MRRMTSESSTRCRANSSTCSRSSLQVRDKDKDSPQYWRPECGGRRGGSLMYDSSRSAANPELSETLLALPRSRSRMRAAGSDKRWSSIQQTGDERRDIVRVNCSVGRGLHIARTDIPPIRGGGAQQEI